MMFDKQSGTSFKHNSCTLVTLKTVLIVNEKFT